MINIDQSPIGRTPRSNPATYSGLFTIVRELFAQVPEARLRGYKPGRFSFNVKGGRCEACRGEGINKIEMHFLPDVYVRCEVCQGLRYNASSLEIRYKGKTIAEVLEMTVDQALEFFGPVPALRDKLQTLADVGLGYIQLGQSATTLSGGEAQRLKLSRELANGPPAAPSTSWTSPPPGSTWRISKNCSWCSTAWWRKATPSSSSNTIWRSSRPRTTSSTWARKAATFN